MSERLQFEQWLPVSVEKVFLFFANPKNLPRIMPPEIDTRLMESKLLPPPGWRTERASADGNDSLAGQGSVIATSFRVIPPLPFRAHWVATITEFEWNHHFADVQTKGPFKQFHHRHEFATTARHGVSGTIVRDKLQYDVGYGFLGVIATKLFVQKTFQRAFSYRQKAVQELLRSSDKAVE